MIAAKSSYYLVTIVHRGLEMNTNLFTRIIFFYVMFTCSNIYFNVTVPIIMHQYIRNINLYIYFFNTIFLTFLVDHCHGYHASIQKSYY